MRSKLKLGSYFVLLMCALMCAANAANADEIEVEAREFVGDQNSKISHLKGGVRIKKGTDTLSAPEAFVYMDAKNRPNKLEAKGGVKFKLTLKDGRKIDGEAQNALYLPEQKEYQLLGAAIVRQSDTNNIVRGDKIIVRESDGYINVVGSENKPARLIFKLER